MAEYQIEFPDYPVADMPAIPAHGDFVDTSWHNDTCPSFTSDQLGLTIWIDYPNSEDREFPQGKRFIVQSQDHGVETGAFSLETDDWNDVLALIEREHSK